LNFLADENCDFAVVRALRENGHNVLAVCEFARRLDDSDVVDLAMREERILMTEDKDFGQLVYARGYGSHGVILLRYPAVTRQRLPGDVVKLVNEKREALYRSFVVVEPGRFRVASLPL
jgi:predicted nuclease of predicted toxin-antitoxin system